ncbi:glycosyltransferase family 4 protein [Dokdonia sp. Hel_I_53]|uniref:glycosyltransferase family 4 protein n=1 Tax=Dokdonia sp. Hel_I_53 TaxID=1566287 RepID=UPI00119C81D7|nr:glycosyltransferase family 4 protein [Dokdonia sp. Hel_I_53]TVZ53388.1 glycosyltransferase involved in cell wall biosynthesis [Dokdonia sp. Hel_I_53]
MDKPSILLIGPAGEYGGREVEMNQVYHSLSKSYDVFLYSTGAITSHSTALDNVDDTSWSCLYDNIYKKSFTLKVLTYLSYFKNITRGNRYQYVNNKLAKEYFGFEEKAISVLKEKINDYELIFICAQVTSKYLLTIIDVASSLNKPIGFRVTGTIFYVPEELKSRLNVVNTFSYHSLLNKANLDIYHPQQSYLIIDQYAILEKQLLKIPLKNTKIRTFGFLGRLSSEKGVDVLLDAFKQIDSDLIIAGDGPLKEKVEITSSQNDNIQFIGFIKKKEIVDFFSDIDCLIICSLEETGPLVALEAMASGTPIISTRVGAMMERFEQRDSIYWIENSSSLDLQQAVVKIKDLSNREIMRLGLDLRGRYLNGYAKAKIQKQYLNFINDIL